MRRLAVLAGFTLVAASGVTAFEASGARLDPVAPPASGTWQAVIDTSDGKPGSTTSGARTP